MYRRRTFLLPHSHTIASKSLDLPCVGEKIFQPEIFHVMLENEVSKYNPEIHHKKMTKKRTLTTPSAKVASSSSGNSKPTGSDPIDKCYLKIQDFDSIDKLLQSGEFDVTKFKQWYEYYLNERNPDALKYMRIFIMKDTARVIEKGFYQCSKNKINIRANEKDLFTQQLRTNKLYHFEEQDVISPVNPQGNLPQTITVLKQDCVEVLIDLHAKGLNPCILNMASRNRAGGGFESGQPSQEVSITWSHNQPQS